LAGKIVAGLVHVNSDSDYSQVRRFVLRAHLHEHAGYFLPGKLNVIGQLDRGFKSELAANYAGNRRDRPNRELSRVAQRDLRL